MRSVAVVETAASAGADASPALPASVVVTEASTEPPSFFGATPLGPSLDDPPHATKETTTSAVRVPTLRRVLTLDWSRRS